jgi:hypothetical protein
VVEGFKNMWTSQNIFDLIKTLKDFENYETDYLENVLDTSTMTYVFRNANSA